MRYLLLNPFDPAFANGVCSYFKNAELILRTRYEIDKFENTFGDSLVDFRARALEYVSANYDHRDVIIEAPETRAATLLFDRRWRVHVRLHAPMGICQKYEGIPIDQSRMSDEIRVIVQAHAVSSASQGLTREMSNYIDVSRFIVNKNPILLDTPSRPTELRDIDVIYLGRVQRLKGSEYLTKILAGLPTGTKVALAGSGVSSVEIPDNVNLRFKSEHINDHSRFELLSRARVAIVPSRFENCSMVILESLATGVPVVAWRVGGNPEFDKSVVTTVPYGNVGEFCSAITSKLDAGHNLRSFHSVTQDINRDYIRGIESVHKILSANNLKANTISSSLYEGKLLSLNNPIARLMEGAHSFRKAVGNFRR